SSGSASAMTSSSYSSSSAAGATVVAVVAAFATVVGGVVVVGLVVFSAPPPQAARVTRLAAMPARRSVLRINSLPLPASHAGRGRELMRSTLLRAGKAT